MISTLNRLWKMQLSNRVPSETLIRNHLNINSRSYYTNTRNKETLYSKISPLGNPSLNLAPELDDWVQKGNKVRFAELQRIVQDLRKRRRVSQALEVSISLIQFMYTYTERIFIFFVTFVFIWVLDFSYTQVKRTKF